MRTSNTDRRHYEFATLSNGLRVLAISDDKLSKTSLSVCVHAGHFDDPNDCHGLAHMLEHMLFLGNQAFPQANGFNQYLAAHNGMVNAWTSTEFTNFHFDVDSDHFEHGCQQFAAMLQTPLLREDAIENEISTIDAEFQAKKKDDLRRLYQVHKETSNPRHPFSKFSVGNKETFGQFDASELAAKLKAFHQKFYVSENAKLCVLSNLDAAQLIQILEDTFSGFSKGDSRPKANYPDLYLADQLAAYINIEPLKQAQRLIITFALPGMLPFYRVKPLSLISHLLGDEGKGSILSYLKTKGWATTLSAGGGIQGSNFKDFNINLQLTDTGIAKVEEILTVIYSYLNLIKQGCKQSWRYQEKSQLSQLAFEYGEQSKSLDEVSQLANQMFLYPDTEVISADYLMLEHNSSVFEQVLDYFQPENMRVKQIFQGVKTEKLAHWYDTPYAVIPLDKSLVARLRHAPVFAELTLPSPNPYLQQNNAFSHALTHTTPQKISASANHEIWFAQDTDFGQPKGDCYVSFDCQALQSGIELTTHKKLWVAMLNDRIIENYYHAGVAGLHYHLYSHQCGFSLNTSGFSSQQLKLSHDIFSDILKFDLDEKAFENCKTRQIQSLQNSLLNKPVNRLFARLSALLQKHTYAPSDMLPILQRARFEQIQDVRQQLLQTFYLEAFVHGDWSFHEAEYFTQELLDMRIKPSGGKLSRDVVNITVQRLNHHVIGHHADSAIVKYFQSPTANTKDIALTILLEQLIAAPFFHHMRTEKQLGYLVGTGYVPINQHPGFALYIQSPNHPSAKLIDEVDAFLDDFLTEVCLQHQLFEKVKRSAIKQLSENDRSLSMKSQRLWLAIGNGDLHFNQQQKLRDTIATLSMDELIEFCHLLANDKFGQLDLYTDANLSSYTALGKRIEDVNQFKQQAGFFK